MALTIHTPLRVFFDGSCPLCHREIAFYRRQSGASRIAWVDVSQMADREISPGLSNTQAMARFHVQDGNGELLSGGKAFVRIWAVLPRFRPLSKFFRIQPFSWLLDRAYNFFLKFRPYLQAMARKNQTQCEQTGTCKVRTRP